MADTYAPQAAPAPAGLLAPPAPPSPSDLLATMRPEPEPAAELSPKQRLLLGPKVLRNETTVSSMPANESLPPQTLISDNINLAARKAQYAETDPSPDPDAVWRKLATDPEVVRDRPGKLLRTLLAGSALPETDWEELSATIRNVDSAIQDVDEDLTVGKGKVSSIYTRPDGVWATLDYGAFESTEDLPASLTGKPSRTLPQATLEWPAKDFSVFVGPSDVVYAGQVSDKHDRNLRSLRPGPIGKDGIPRWVAVQPLPVTTHRAVEGLAVANPGTVIDSYVHRDAYPGLNGGDWLVWDVPQQDGPRGWRPPMWMKGRAKPLKAGVGTSSPKYNLSPVALRDIPDQVTLDLRLDDTAWAVFEAQGEPHATSRLVGRLKKRGFEPIELETEGRRAWLAFGVDPATASTMSPRRPVYTNDGVITDGEEPDPRLWQFRTASGTVVISSRPGITAGAMPRTGRRSDRWAFQVDPQDAKRLAGFATEMEATGGQNVAIYSREAEIDGFEGAREYLFHDGVSLKVVRTTSPTVGDPNAIPLHVRSTKGLPSNRPQVAGSAISLSGIPFQESGRSVTLESGDDLEQAVQQAAILAAVYGHDKVKVNGPSGRLRLWVP